jgi:hypothetical protein
LADLVLGDDAEDLKASEALNALNDRIMETEAE